MTLVDATTAATNLAAVRRRIDAVERRWSHSVSITAVTKGFGPEVIDIASVIGADRIGENYAQELLTKTDALDALDQASGRATPRVDFIGQLQSNKVRQLVGVVDRWATVDRASLAEEIAKRDPGASVLIQVNSTGEPQKGGCAPADVDALVQCCADLGLDVEGMLTVGPTNQPTENATPCFESVRTLVDEHGLAVCSMGMSNDLEVAVAAGSTNVRIGTAIFGRRPSTDAAAR